METRGTERWERKVASSSYLGVLVLPFFLFEDCLGGLKGVMKVIGFSLFNGIRG